MLKSLFDVKYKVELKRRIYFNMTNFVCNSMTMDFAIKSFAKQLIESKTDIKVPVSINSCSIHFRLV